MATSKAGPLQPDVEKDKSNLAGYLTARRNVSSYVVGVQKVSLGGINFKTLPASIQSKLPADPATLLATLQKNLDTAQNNALHWSNDIEPNLTEIPQAIINFNAKFETAAGSISTWLGQLADGNDANKGLLLQTLTWLISQIDAQTKAIETEMTLIKGFNTQLVQDHKNFSSSNSAFGILYTYEEASIKNLNEAITGLKAALKSEEKAITAAGIALGVGLGLGVAGGIGLATAETGVGAIIAGVVIIAGVGTAIAGIVLLVEAINEKVATENTINQDKTAVTLLGLQAGALKNVEDSLHDLVDLSEKAISAVQVILDTWGTLKVKIVAVASDLKSAEGSDLGKITAVFDVTAASTQWGELQTFATQMQTYTQQAYQDGILELKKGGKVTPIKLKMKKAS